MAKIVRYNGNLVPFASASLGTERTVFGEVTQADDITSQYTADFLRGWGIVGPSDQPTLQDFNAVSYTHGQILSYLHQIGIAEYNASQEYHIDSLCNVAGVVYSSLINANVGNTPASSPSQWGELYRQATESIRGTAAVATQATAEAGLDDEDIMTALKVRQAINSGTPLDTTRINVSSAATVSLTASAPNTRHVNITGTTTITAFTVAVGKCYFVRFDNALTLTNNASIVTQTGGDILTVAGDTCIIRSTSANVIEVLCYSRVQRLTSGASQTATGTSIDFVGIPSWVQKITVLLSNISTNGTSGVLFQIGSGSVDTTGYVSSSAAYDTGVSAMSSTAGYVLRQIVAANASHGSLELYRVTGNQWVMSGAVGNSGTAGGTTMGGSKTLSGALDRIRMTSVNGTDTFDSGNINIIYQG